MEIQRGAVRVTLGTRTYPQRFLKGTFGTDAQVDPAVRAQPNPNGDRVIGRILPRWENVRIVPMDYRLAAFNAPNAGYPGPPVNIRTTIVPEAGATGSLRRAAAPNADPGNGAATVAGFPQWAVWAVGAFLAWKFLKG